MTDHSIVNDFVWLETPYAQKLNQYINDTRILNDSSKLSNENFVPEYKQLGLYVNTDLQGAHALSQTQVTPNSYPSMFCQSDHHPMPYTNQVPVTQVTEAQSTASNGRPSFGYIGTRAELEVEGYVPFVEYSNQNVEKDILKEALSSIVTSSPESTDNDARLISDIDKGIQENYGEEHDLPGLDAIDLKLLDDLLNSVPEGPEQDSVDSGSHEVGLVVQPSGSNPLSSIDNQSPDVTETNLVELQHENKRSHQLFDQENDSVKEKPSKRMCLWQIKEPFEDKAMEKKRLDAIRARKNRMKNKTGKQSLEEKLENSKEENEKLKKEIEQFKLRENTLKKRQDTLEMIVKRMYSPSIKTVENAGQIVKIIYI